MNIVWYKQFVGDASDRTVVSAVVSLIFNLFFAFYYGLLGVLSSSPLFAASFVYFFLLAAMRFAAVIAKRTNRPEHDRKNSVMIGIMLMILSIVFSITVIVSMTYQTAVSYGTIPMIAIATFTFSKITAAIVSAVKYRKEPTLSIRSLRAIRYSEIAVSLLTMQQSMLVSFGEANDHASVILNAFTGAGVCFFIFSLGIFTYKTGRT